MELSIGLAKDDVRREIKFESKWTYVGSPDDMMITDLVVDGGGGGLREREVLAEVKMRQGLYSVRGSI